MSKCNVLLERRKDNRGPVFLVHFWVVLNTKYILIINFSDGDTTLKDAVLEREILLNGRAMHMLVVTVC